jgi:RsiW-degrading membrane proteinase PrsW (M82 family)
MLVVAGLIAILLPLLFLYVVYALDLYSSGSFRTVAVCFAWGLVAFGLSYGLNTAVKEGLLEGPLGMDQFRALTVTVVLVAPIVEELAKSLILIYLGRRPDFTYFVDGAIYGFAAGIAFSILENFFYIAQAGGGSQGAMAVVSRSFSTCLMHGSASALVGAAIGRFRYEHGRSRLISAVVGWAAAIVLHSVFNRVVEFASGPGFLLGAVGLGAGGVGLIAIFIRWGLAEEKRWIGETLDIGLGVTDREKSVVLDLDKVQELLEPIRQRFGKKKGAQVEAFLVKQAQLGIKQKSRNMSEDPQLRAEIDSQIEALRADMNRQRREVGVYVMYYVRSIFPPATDLFWGGLQDAILKAQEKGQGSWSIFDSVEQLIAASGEQGADQGQAGMWGKLQDATEERRRKQQGG